MPGPNCGPVSDTMTPLYLNFHSSEGAKMANLSGIVEQLKRERDVVEKQLSALNAALTAFVGAYGGTAKRKMSAASRRKISLAQKARWAKRNGQASAARPKRTMSASARRKIAAAQRARWAKVRAKQK
jgi:hypothetical protein